MKRQNAILLAAASTSLVFIAWVWPISPAWGLTIGVGVGVLVRVLWQ